MLLLVVLTLPIPTRAGTVDPAIERTHAGAQAIDGCTQGLRDVARTDGFIAAMVPLGAGRLIGVGGITVDKPVETDFRILSATRDAGGWSFATTDGPGGTAAALTAIAARNRRVWAAGFRFLRGGDQRPLVVRRVSGAWVDASPPSASGIATAIATDAAGSVWVTTTERGPGGAQARLWRRSHGRWQRVSLPSVVGVERFAAIAAPSGERTLIAGTTVTATGVQAVILARQDAGWTRERVRAGDAQVVLSALQASGAATVAAGWVLDPGRIRPITVRRGADGTWSPQPLGGPTGTASIITDLSLDGSDIVQAGSSYPASAGDWLPARASRGPDPSWLAVERRGWFIRSIVGDPATTGWLSASATSSNPVMGSVIGRTCDTAPIDDAVLRRRMTALRNRATARARDAGPRRADRARDLPKRGVDPGPSGALTGGVRLRDIAVALGLPSSSSSYGIDSGDVNGDGRPDLVWSRHGGTSPSVFLQTDDGFVRAATAIGARDRHQCAAVPLDGDATADIACVTGAGHGLGITANELYLDPVGHPSRDIGTERGLTDPVGRGRFIVSLDAEGDGDMDLYIGNQERNDGLPNLDRLLLNDGEARFSWARTSGLNASFGVVAAVARDLDRDGRMDLLVSQDAEEASGPGIHLYRNVGGRFVDIAADAGVRSIGERDVEAGQLDGRSRLDLVQLSEDRLRVSVWRDGRYRVVLDRGIDDGQAVAIGDVDGDGDHDLYVALGTKRDPASDLILINDGTATGWRSVTVPDSRDGTPDDVLAMDVDRDGRDEFIVVAGRRQRGPFRVIDGH